MDHDPDTDTIYSFTVNVSARELHADDASEIAAALDDAMITALRETGADLTDLSTEVHSPEIDGRAHSTVSTVGRADPSGEQ